MKNPNEYDIIGKIAYIYLCNRQGQRISYAIIDIEDAIVARTIAETKAMRR